MIYKTLHWYILRELLRIFLLTAGALTTLLAFGGTFKPLTKQGIEIGQLMLILVNLMPAMLAYAIPMAALFAAVLVYWRMSTDNEVTACRAGGISFWAMVFPALLLGLMVASADLVFVNYVVPVFLQRTEKAVRSDLGTLLVHNIGQQEPFEWDSQSGRLIVYADSGTQRPTEKVNTPDGVDERTVVTLFGVAATPLDKQNKPTAIIASRRANVIIDEFRRKDEVHIIVQLEDGAAFNPNTFQKMSGTIRSLPPDGHPFIIPSLFKDKPKFLNYIQLRQLERDPTHFGPIDDLCDSIQREIFYQEIAWRYFQRWSAEKVLRWDQSDGKYIVLHTPQAGLDAEKHLVFARLPQTPIQVEQYDQGRMISYYKCDRAEFFLADEGFGTDNTPSLVTGGLRLLGTIYFHDMTRGIPESQVEKEIFIEPLTLAASLVGTMPPRPDLSRLSPAAIAGYTPHIQDLFDSLGRKIVQLSHSIGSELHSRGSFALSCLTLVLLGAALGIMMRGRNPLMVFVVGFAPAIVLVLLITAGRKMVENSLGSPASGYSVIWAGNLILVALVVSVYAKLLRQ